MCRASVEVNVVDMDTSISSQLKPWGEGGLTDLEQDVLHWKGFVRSIRQLLLVVADFLCKNDLSWGVVLRRIMLYESTSLLIAHKKTKIGGTPLYRAKITTILSHRRIFSNKENDRKAFRSSFAGKKCTGSMLS